MSTSTLRDAAATGLTREEAARRLAADGANELPRQGRRSLWRIAVGVAGEPMFALLIAGALIYLLLGDRTEALLLAAFATLSVMITIVQESRSERVLDRLADLAAPRALLVREGERVLVAAREVVRGDLMVLLEGDRIAADGTLVHADDLLVDESLLTGESVAVRKQPNGMAPGATMRPGGDDQPRVYAGSLVVRGQGLAVADATAAATEMGAIGRSLGSIETGQARLQQQLQWLVRDFALVGSAAGVLAVVLYGMLRGGWLQALLGGIALGMSVLPEEFPLVLAVFMAMGAWRISRARVLTRRASAIETLGETTVLCSDKTGTLTENRMRVAEIAAAADPDGMLAHARLACPDLAVDPMDLALVRAAADRGIGAGADPALRPALRSYGLRPELLAVTVVRRDADGAALVCVKGAPEAVFELCRLSDGQRAGLAAEVGRLAALGMRVLGVAHAALGAGQAASLPDSPREFDCRWDGLLAFADPLRASVPAAVRECHQAGIRVLMITGDFPVTAQAIARQAGIPAGRVLTGDQLDALEDGALAAQLRDTSVFARIRPAQKLRLVECLKANGEVVAMTGDGVNDAPAIKAAHIGVAMGGRGTDVAREAAAIVLLDDSFDAIVQTIRLGRRIHDNLRKAIEYIVAVHIPIVGLALLPLLSGMPLLLMPVHIAFLEMLIDPACSVVFEAEREERDVMQRPPRDPASPLLLRRRVLWALIQGVLVLSGLAAVVTGAARLGVPADDLRALAFTGLVLTNLGLILVNRSFDASLRTALTRPNRSLAVLAGGIAAGLALALGWAPARALLRFGTLHWDDLALCGAVGALSVLVLEQLKARWFGPQHNDGKAA